MSNQPSPKSHRASWLLYVILALGIGLRLALAWVNVDANDDHLAVIKIIADEGRFPAITETWQAYHPKLYHAAVALLWQTLPPDAASARLRVAQLVSAAAGITTLLIVYRYLHRLALPEEVRLIAFAGVALNPKLIGIAAQATNDSLVIMLATAALYGGYRFFTRWRRWDFALMTAATALATITKGNGLILLVVGTLALIGAWLKPYQLSPPKNRRLLPSYALAFIFIVVSVAATLGPYASSYRHTGSPFAINVPALPLPPLLTKVNHAYPSVASIADSYATFRFINLLQEPIIIFSRSDSTPRHEKSLWSQLYGRTHFVHFDAWPPTWEMRGRAISNLGRAILILALLPTGLFVLGLLRAGGHIIHWLATREQTAAMPPRQLLLYLTTFGYLIFIILFTLRYQRFSTMKAVYIFPGLLGFLAIFVEECEWWHRRWRQRPLVHTLVAAAFVSLFILYTADSAVLLLQL
jgi:hypothetical protein